MRVAKRLFCCGLAVLCIVLIVGMGPCHAKPKVGNPAPLFLLKDLNGKGFELAAMKDQPMVIVYFFDAKSSSSMEGLMHLDKLAKKYKDADLVVWGVTRSGKNKVKSFLARTKMSFPVLLDSGKVSDIYSARVILPTVCIIGPDLKLLDYFQGGGKNTENMLVTLAERKLQNRQSKLAKAISAEVTKKNPKNIRARAVTATAELKEGNLKKAEKTFKEISKEKGKGKTIGQDGLAQVYLQKNEPEKAMKLAKASGQSAQSHILKGDLLSSQNKLKAAEKEYRKAAKKPGASPIHRATAYNSLGRILAMRGQDTEARRMFDKAVVLDAYLVEATTNKGMIYERQGKWDKALEAYSRAKAIDRNDPFAAALAQNAKKMMLISKDPDKRKKMERRIATYVKRYKEGAVPQTANPQDDWTSNMTIMTMVEPVESKGLSRRDGFGRILAIYLSTQLNSSGRVKVIEPSIVETVLKRLGLTRKDLKDPKVVRRLADAFGARLISEGTLHHLSEGTLLNLKLSETRGQGKSHTIQRQFISAVTLRIDLRWLNREILTSIMSKYPLQGYVAEVTGNQILINLGEDQGVVIGSLFDVVEVKPAVSMKGKTFQPAPKVMANIEVVKVFPEFAYAHIKDQRRPIKVEDKIMERVESLGEDGQRVW